MRTHALASALALGILTAGCIDVLEPGPPREDAVLNLHLTAGRLEGLLEVSGSLYPGIGSFGSAGRIEDPFLRLWETSVAPDTLVGSDHIPVIVWEGTAPMASPPPDSLRVRIPRVEDRSPDDLSLGLPRPLDGSVLPLPAPGEDLVLRLAPRASDLPAPVRVSWDLRIDGWRGGERVPNLVRLSAATPIPDSIRAPAAWLGSEPLDSLEAVLEQGRIFDYASADGGYRARVQMDEVLRWTAKAASPGPL